MIKYLKYQGNTYEGLFMPLPGKQNYGHLMVDGSLLKNVDNEEVIFILGRAEEVFIKDNDDFMGFANLNEEAKMKPQVQKEIEKPKPIKLNKREEIHAMSKDAEEIMIAIRKYATDGVVFVKDVKDVNQNKLYGHLINLENAKMIKRIGKDKKRGTKIKILK